MRKPTNSKKVQVNFYVTPQFKKEIQEMAEAVDLSTSMYINLAVQTLITIHETGQIPQLTLSRLFREFNLKNPPFVD